MKSSTTRSLGLAAALLCSISAKADPVQYSVSVPVTTQYDSNPNLSTSGSRGVLMESITPKLDVTRVWGPDLLGLTLGANIQRSTDQAETVNRNDPNIGLRWTHQDELNTFNLSGQYSQTSARDYELQQTGLVVADRTQANKSLNASWTRLLSERLSFNVGANYSKVTYSGSNQGSPNGLGLNDYTTAGVNTGLNYDLSEISSASLTAGASVYTPSGTSLPVSHYQNLMLGYTRAVNDHWQWSAQVGIARIEAQSTNNAWQGSFTGTYKADRWNSSLTVGRLVTPSGATGGFSNSNQITWQAGYELTERLKAGAQANWMRSQSEGGLSGLGQSSSRMVGLSLSYELSPTLSLALIGQRRQIDYTLFGRATDNMVGLTLTYSRSDF